MNFDTACQRETFCFSSAGRFFTKFFLFSHSSYVFSTKNLCYFFIIFIPFQAHLKLLLVFLVRFFLLSDNFLFNNLFSLYFSQNMVK